jgi:hypothetical protein
MGGGIFLLYVCVFVCLCSNKNTCLRIGFECHSLIRVVADNIFEDLLLLQRHVVFVDTV